MNGIEFFKNLNKKTEQNSYEEFKNDYNNSHVFPPFKKYLDDNNRDLTSKQTINFKYKNKSRFGVDIPSQTEHDEVPVYEEFLNKYYGYTDYGNYKYQNSSFPSSLEHKLTPIENTYELF